MYKNEPGVYEVYSFVRSDVIDDSYFYTETTLQKIVRKKSVLFTIPCSVVSGLYVPITCNIKAVSTYIYDQLLTPKCESILAYA